MGDFFQNRVQRYDVFFNLPNLFGGFFFYQIIFLLFRDVLLVVGDEQGGER